MGRFVFRPCDQIVEKLPQTVFVIFLEFTLIKLTAAFGKPIHQIAADVSAS